MKEFIRQLRLSTNAMEKIALEQNNDKALEHFDNMRNLINDVEESFKKLAELGIEF